MVECPYCGREAALVDSSEVYSKSYGKIWLCHPCSAWVGVHKGTDRPLGTLADDTTRHARKMAHRRFDPIWKSKKQGRGKARSKAYAWLAEELGITPAGCHIGLFDVETCVRVIEICVAKARGNTSEV